MKTTRGQKEGELVKKIYARLYAEADPKGNWENMVATGEIYGKDFFMNYVLDDGRQVEIIESLLKEAKVSKRQWEKYKFFILLGAAPTGVRRERVYA